MFLETIYYNLSTLLRHIETLNLKNEDIESDNC